MWRDVIAMRVRHKRQPFRIPGVEPEILVREINAALVSDLDHRSNYARKRAVATFRVTAHALTLTGMDSWIAR